MSQSDFKSLEWPFKDPKFIFFTDFDGTITLQDSNDYMTDTIGFGKEIREGLNRDILDGKITFRQMMDSVKKPFPECVEYLVKNIKLDPHFNEYYQWALKNQIPTVIVSSGMQPIIRAVLKNLVGDDADKLTIVCNEPEARPWQEVRGRGRLADQPDSGFGHDKSLTLRPYANLPADKRPTLFYAGDGVSDLSAARETDLLFAKKGRDLIKYCAREEVPFTVFEDWSSILATVQDIVAGKKSVQQAADEGYKAYKEGGAGLNGAAK
ncbi:hypothetical protein D0863_00429 [Hortaea werneckii]|uniref:2,3-diketo-5-methylthio-1-phosphopentane phosphatase n=1 Tax=Hortaea werneckii TaxID=91943 RepID=A0A3M7EQK2_HORWE|nr:hypothetical protein D0863_00429 [Hortaea werneckii]